MIQANQQAVQTVVEEVLAQLGNRGTTTTSVGASPDGDWGVFSKVDDAVDAATRAFRQLQDKTIEDRARAIACVVRICSTQCDELGRAELEETRIGRLDHKIEKLQIVKLVPGTEFLRCDALSGDRGLTVIEYAPFGVIGAITPVTHSLPTLAGNVVNMVASGNTLVVNPHPSGARIACEGVRRFNKAIHEELAKMSRGMPILATTGSTAPFVGLFGTTFGVINAFQGMATAGSGLASISAGISEALITTKFGLVVAVPALICHAFVTRKVKGVLGSMEQVSIGFINGLRRVFAMNPCD